jgi:DNA-binding NtrC family response regulator
VLRILAVDDDPAALELLRRLLGGDHRVDACGGGAEALARLEADRYDLVIADLDMPPPDGFDVLGAAQRRSPPPAVVVLSALDRARSTMKALSLGARDYLVKPATPDEIRATVDRVASDSAQAETGRGYGLVGVSAAIAQVRRTIPLLARSQESVLLTGETGTGKELLARAIHEHGPRAAGPFVAHNMAATPFELAESLFFGHVRGSFSGATADHAGLFENADSGTLFLDEVDSFPLGLQAKLLRVLESGWVQRVGSGIERPVNARVIAASAVELGERIESGRFRSDLYYRLRQLEVVLPPLRERMEDVPVLAAHFLDEFSAESGRRYLLPAETMTGLLRHAWPGNGRELRNAVRSAALLAGEGAVLVGHLPRAVRAEGAAKAGTTGLAQVERDHILETLRRAGGNQSLAARLLGIDRGTLARKMRAFTTAGIGEDDGRAPK